MQDQDGKIGAEKEKTMERIVRASRNLLPAFRDMWMYMAFGLVLGGIFVEVSEHSNGVLPKFIVDFLNHVGMGLVVSAVAVLFYEWGGHFPKVFSLSKRLLSTGDEMVAVKKDYQRLKAENAMRQGIKQLLGEARDHPGREELAALESSCCEIVLGIAHLRHQGWPGRCYVGVVRTLLRDVIDGNLKTLVSISRGQSGDHHFRVPPTAAEHADMILAAQMNALGREARRRGEPVDGYDVISDFTSWEENSMGLFVDATERAVARGVVVRRIFYLFAPKLDSTNRQSARRVLQQHFDHTTQWNNSGTGEGRYEIRCVGKPGIVRGACASPLLDSERALAAHFGIFIYGRDRIRFSVQNANLSDMAVSMEVEKDTLLFESVWNKAEPLTQETIDKLGAGQGDPDTRRTP